MSNSWSGQIGPLKHHGEVTLAEVQVAPVVREAASSMQRCPSMSTNPHKRARSCNANDAIILALQYAIMRELAPARTSRRRHTCAECVVRLVRPRMPWRGSCRIRRDHAVLEDEAVIEAASAGLDREVRLFRKANRSIEASGSERPSQASIASCTLACTAGISFRCPMISMRNAGFRRNRAVARTGSRARPALSIRSSFASAVWRATESAGKIRIAEHEEYRFART